VIFSCMYGVIHLKMYVKRSLCFIAIKRKNTNECSQIMLMCSPVLLTMFQETCVRVESFHCYTADSIYNIHFVVVGFLDCFGTHIFFKKTPQKSKMMLILVIWIATVSSKWSYLWKTPLVYPLLSFHAPAEVHSSQ
jgi:hypothetical protein